MKYLSLFLFLFCFGCKFTTPGTNTGNPFLGSSPAMEYRGALLLGFRVCEKIKSCYANSDFDNCLDQAFNSTNYPNELGLTAGNFSTLTALQAAETNNQVNPNRTNFANCEQAIERLVCSDSLIQSAYSTLNPTDFRATNILFRTTSACSLIY